MFKDTKAFSGFSVDDAEKAKHFYGTILGLDIRPVAGMETYGMLELHLATGARVLLYQKQGHAPATFTVLSFPVDNIDDAVDELTKRGVETLKYNDANIPQDDKGICRGLSANRGPDIAWFADPAGNNLAVLQDR